MEKRKSLLDDPKLQKKLSKLSPEDKEKVEKNIIETEQMEMKRLRRETGLMQLSKEDRLKVIYGRHLRDAFVEGIMIGQMSLTEGSKWAGQYFRETSWKRLRPALTEDLKKFKVLPLGR